MCVCIRPHMTKRIWLFRFPKRSSVPLCRCWRCSRNLACSPATFYPWPLNCSTGVGPYSTHLKLTCWTQFLQPSFCIILTYFADQVIYIMIRWLIRWVLSLGNLMMEHPSAGFCMVKSALLIVPLYNPNSPTFFCIVKSCVLMVKSHEVSTFHAELPTRRTRDPHVPGEALRGPALPAWPPARTPRGKPLRHDAAAVSNRQAGWGELEGIYFL